jgi:hypothetical protein
MRANALIIKNIFHVNCSKASRGVVLLSGQGSDTSRFAGISRRILLTLFGDILPPLIYLNMWIRLAYERECVSRLDYLSF